MFATSLVYAGSAPGRARSAWVTSAASSGVANLLAKDGLRAGEPARAVRLAREALARSPVNVEAARTLALAYAVRGRQSQATTMMRYSERLSRRDVPTQIWLIEERVRANDSAGAIVHYDRAMQTSPPSRALLSPILASAADIPEITKALAPVLRTRPEWWSAFLGNFVEQTQSPTALGLVTRSLHLNPTIDVERERLSTILQRYVALGDAADGRRLFDRMTGRTPASIATVVDGDFEHDTALPPFGWQFADTPASAGTREERRGQDGAFALSLDGNEGHEAARQLLNLAAGSYELRAKVGGVRPGFSTPPIVGLRCASPADLPIAEANAPTAQPVATMTLRFTVPPTCVTQWLTISTARATGYIDDAPWIDTVVLRRVDTPRGK